MKFRYCLILIFSLMLIAFAYKYCNQSDSKGNTSEPEIVEEETWITNPKMDYTEAGKQLYQLLASSKDTTCIVHADDFEIQEYEINIKEIYFKSNQFKNPRKEAIDECIRLKTLYAESIKNGFSVTDQEVKDSIKIIKESIKSDKEGKIKKYLACFKDQQLYWDYEYEVVHDNMVIQKYLTEHQRDFYKKNKLEPTNENLALWEKSVKELEKHLIKQHHVKILS